MGRSKDIHGEKGMPLSAVLDVRNAHTLSNYGRLWHREKLRAVAAKERGDHGVAEDHERRAAEWDDVMTRHKERWLA